MTSSRDESKMIKECFFTLIADTTWKFSCKLYAEAGLKNSTIEVRPGSGYTNFKVHLQSKLHSGAWKGRFEAYHSG